MEDHARNRLFCPVLRSRGLSLALFGAGALHIAFTSAGLSGWPCPFLGTFGLTCPGCGLGKACALLLQGDLKNSLMTHAFAPVAIATAGLALIISILPKSPRNRAIDALERLETRTKFSWMILIGLLLYWAAGIALDFRANVPLLHR
jgi:hypothetical protein